MDERLNLNSSSEEGDPFLGNDELHIKLQAIADSRHRVGYDDGLIEENQNEIASR